MFYLLGIESYMLVLHIEPSGNLCILFSKNVLPAGYVLGAMLCLGYSGRIENFMPFV